MELGPRGTGKSYAYQELSPYVILLTGPTTVANLFYNMATGKMGLVGIWDAVAFDEVADLQKMPKEVVTTLKTYCESGMFARGKDSLSGQASLAMFGNTNQPVDVMVRSSHLFTPMPDVIREDMAFLDRLHFYIPGWEIPKMRVEFFTDHYGFVVDYLAEALRELRKHNFTEIIDRHFSLGSHLNARDVKAVRKTVSGLVKLLYPARRAVGQRAGGTGRDGSGRPSPGQGTAQEDGVVRVPPDLVQLHRQREPGGAVRRRPRAGRPGHDLDRPAGAGLGLRRLGGRPGQGRALSAGGRLLAGDRQAEDRRRHRGHDEGVDPAGLRLPSGPEGARWASVSRWTRPTSTSRRSIC